MPLIRIRWNGVNDGEEEREVQVERPPEHWNIADAKTFIQSLVRATATPGIALTHIDAIRLRHVEKACVVLEVETNSGAVLTEPVAASSLAAAYLEEAVFEMPGCGTVQ
jgi:hypothetical protein